MKKPKEPKEKKPKKEKVPKEKKPKKPKKGQTAEQSEEQEGQGKKKKKFPILLLIPVVVLAVVAAVVVFVLLPGKDDDPDAVVSEEPVPPSLPPEYMVGDLSIAGMTLGADESAAKAVPAKTVVYTYVDLEDAGKAAQTYVEQLQGADPRFYVVDEEFVRTEKPDFTAQEGMVLMARNIPVEKPESSAEPEASPEGEESPGAESAQPSPTPEPSPTPDPDEEPRYVLTVRMEWSKGQCVVTADEAEGRVTSAPQGPGGVMGSTMGQYDAKDYLKSLEPKVLGLSGESMDAYEVFIMDGVVRVNDLPCTKLNVYDENDVFAGCYMVSVDGQHLYQLNPMTGNVIELKMP